MFTNWKRPEKGIARDFAMRDDGTEFDTIFCMPSHSCLDLKEGIKSGFLNRNHKVVAVDRVPENWPKIERFLKKNFNDYIFFKGDVKDFPMREMIKAKGFAKVGFAFFDLCGHLNAHLTYWLHVNRECFNDTCRFGITIKAANRKKESWEKTVHRGAIEMEYAPDLENLLADARNNLSKDVVGMPVDVEKSKQLVKKKQSLYATNVIRSIKAQCYAFMIALNNKEMAIDRLYRYKDIDEDKKHVEMVFIDFRFHGVADGDDYCIDLIKEFDKKVCYNAQVLRYGRTATYKKRKVEEVVLKTAYDIARHMGIFGSVESITELSKAKQSWITINAKRIGLDPNKVKLKIEKKLENFGLQAA